MAARPKWQHDEMKHCGVDFDDEAIVQGYDSLHLKFQDYEKDADNIITTLGLGNSDTVIDMGCGTGAFAVHAAKFCKRIYAVDVSKAMLEYTRKKAAKAGLNNIEFCHGGFLTYEHCAEPVDVIVSKGALHHIPDFWKLIGLKRIVSMLKTEGKFFLGDVVFSFDVAEYSSFFNQWVESGEQNVGPELRAEMETHARAEYSTFDWVMEGLLERAGFKIEENDYKDGFLASYVCTKS